MFRSQFIFLAVLPLISFSSVKCAVINPFSMKDVKTDWSKNKLETLMKTVETLLKHTGDVITIIASEDIHNPDGSFKEIKTIELKIPKMFTHEARREETDFLEKLKRREDDFGDILKKMLENFRVTFEKYGYEHNAAYQKVSEDEEVEIEFFVARDEAIVEDEDGMVYKFKHGITSESRGKLEKEFKRRFKDRKNGTFVSVLVWDKDHKFENENSMVESTLMTYVDKASDNVDEKMMETAMEALTKYVLNDPERVAKELSAAMSNAYPDYIWFVTKWQDENAANAKHDLFIKMTYDNVSIGESQLEYTVYGIKK